MQQKSGLKSHFESEDSKMINKEMNHVTTEIKEENHADSNPEQNEIHEDQHEELLAINDGSATFERNHDEESYRNYYSEQEKQTKDNSKLPIDQTNTSSAEDSIHDLFKKQKEIASNLNSTTED